MGLGNRSLPSRAAGTDPHVTFPVVTVSGRHSLMLSVEGQCMCRGGVAAPPLSGRRGLCRPCGSACRMRLPVALLPLTISERGNPYSRPSV